MRELWQSLEKSHLDVFGEIHHKEWEEFVNQYQDEFASKCSEIGEQLFNQFLNERNSK